MLVSVPLQGFGLTLRSAAAHDAAFIHALRHHPALCRFLGDSAATVAGQEAWIAMQQKRPLDAYFVCESLQRQALGTIGLYAMDPTKRCGEWGRWVMTPGVPAAVPSILLLFGYAFDELALDSVFCQTAEDNTQVVAFHDQLLQRQIHNTPPTTVIKGRQQRLVVHTLSRVQWPSVRRTLEPLARAAARFLE